MNGGVETALVIGAHQGHEQEDQAEGRRADGSLARSGRPLPDREGGGRNALFVLFIGGILAYGGPGSPGSFRYGAFDANARTAIIVFPSEGGEVSFDVDFSSIS